MSERRRATLWGVVFGYATVGLALARNIALVPLYLHFIRLTEYGSWLATGGALALLMVNDFGFSGVVGQRAAVWVGSQQWKQLRTLLGSSLLVSLVLALGLSVLSLVPIPFLPALDGLTAVERHRVLVCYVIAVAANAAGVVSATGLGLIRSFQKPILAGGITLLGDAALIVLTLAGLLLGWGLFAIAAGFALRSAVATLLSLAAVRRIAAAIPDLGFAWDAQQARALIGDSSRFFLAAVASRLQMQSNTFFVGACLGPGSAAVYGLTVRAYETVWLLIGQINFALAAPAAHLIGSGNTLRFRQLITRLLPALTFITVLGMAIAAIANAPFLRLWVGPGIFAGQQVSVLMATALAVASVSYVAYDVLLAHGEFAFISRIFLRTSVLHVVLLVICLRFGLWAAPAATLLSSALWGLVFWRRVIASVALDSREVGAMFGQTAAIGGIAVAVAVAWEWIFPFPREWISLIGQSAGAVVVLAGLTLLALPALRRIFSEEFLTSLRALRAL